MASRFIEAPDGTRLAVYEEGNDGGPIVVFVHGWPDSHVVWDGVAELLAGDYRIIRYDNRGAGASSVPESVSAYAFIDAPSQGGGGRCLIGTRSGELYECEIVADGHGGFAARAIREFLGHATLITSISLSPDGTRFATSSLDELALTDEIREDLFRLGWIVQDDEMDE